MHTHTYTYKYTHTLMHTHTCIHKVCTHMHICTIYTNIQIYIHTSTHTHIHTCTHKIYTDTCVYTQAYTKSTYIHKHKYTHAHTYTYKDTHTQMYICAHTSHSHSHTHTRPRSHYPGLLPSQPLSLTHLLTVFSDEDLIQGLPIFLCKGRDSKYFPGPTDSTATLQLCSGFANAATGSV